MFFKLTSAQLQNMISLLTNQANVQIYLLVNIYSGRHDMQLKELELIARQIRRRDLQAVFEAGAGHIGGEMSVIDMLTALYFHVLSVSPDAPQDPNRDRFVLSKGHTACALYVTLAKRGFIPEDEISTFLKPHSRLNGHPNRNKVPGVETNTGPLGHGLPVAVGMAKAAKLSGADYHTYVITGDGEMQEGSKLGSDHVGRAIWSRQSDAGDRSQPLPAGCILIRHERYSTVASKAGSVRLGGDGNQRQRHVADRPGIRTSRFTPPLHRRPHQQGPWHFLHAGPGRLASQGAEQGTI